MESMLSLASSFPLQPAKVQSIIRILDGDIVSILVLLKDKFRGYCVTFNLFLAVSSARSFGDAGLSTTANVPFSSGRVFKPIIRTMDPSAAACITIGEKITSLSASTIRL